jgi:Zn-dependent protease/CBS domain-containing protein
MATPTRATWPFDRRREHPIERNQAHAPDPANPPRTGWSWRIGRIVGVDIYVHATFVLLLGWVALSHVMQGHGAFEAISGVALIVSVFAIVVLHELGHVLVARHFGIGTREITLLPIGGVARLDRMPDDPKQELLVAIAGPAVNVALAILLFCAVALMSLPFGMRELQVIGGPFVTKLMWVNVGLAVFNLIPAFPMDGGRVLRALLAMRMSHVRATDLAARIGRGLAVAFGFAGFFFNPMLVLIALFVWIGATQEARAEHVRSSLDGLAVRDAMITKFRALSPTETVAHAVEHALGGFQHDFPVVDGDRVVGVLTRVGVLRAIASNAAHQMVGDCMQRVFAVAEDSEPLTTAMQRVDLAACPAVPVVHRGRLAGILTPERIGELVLLREAAANRTGS